MNGINLIIDFDSTFVKVETLDLLAEICFNNDANKSQKIKNISMTYFPKLLNQDRMALKSIIGINIVKGFLES